jgi:hypothetical protein
MFVERQLNTGCSRAGFRRPSTALKEAMGASYVIKHLVSE